MDAKCTMLATYLILLLHLSPVMPAMDKSKTAATFERRFTDERARLRRDTDGPSGCRVYPAKRDFNQTIAELIDSGNVQLIEYTIQVNDSVYDEVVWNIESMPLYEPNRWTRVVSIHGRALLALVFNYDVVSLQTLSFGVHRLDVELEEDNCTSTSERARAIRWLIYNDFDLEHAPGNSGHREVCNQVIDGRTGKHSIFEEKCYNISQQGGEPPKLVGEIVYNKWIHILHGLLEFVRIFLILFGPLVFQSWLYTGDMQSSVPYVVHTEKKHDVELDLSPRKQRDTYNAEDHTTPMVSQSAPHVPMTKLRSTIETKSQRQISRFHLKTRRINIVVDHTKLMAQSAVPVNLFTFIKDELFGCGILKRMWLRSCSVAGCLFGRWPPSWRPSDTDRIIHFPPKEPTWGRMFKVCAAVFVAVIVIPLPFHVRVIVYSMSEQQEMETRLEATRSIGFHDPYYESFWYGPHWPFALGAVYSLYLVSLTLFAVAQNWLFNAFDDVIQDCIYDLQRISYSSILSMLFYHLVAPFKEFGFLLGPLFAIPYYIFVLPLAFLIAIFYGVPTFYMIGRLFYNFRPHALEVPMCFRRIKDNDNLVPLDEVRSSKPSPYIWKKSGSTFSRTFDLERISPENRLYPRLPVQRLRDKWMNKCHTKTCRYFISFAISLVTLVLMLTVVLMYAEALRFFLHVILLGLSGLVLNASHTMDYFILCFWTFMYSVQTIKTIHGKYNQMSQHLFKFLKNHLSENIGDATRVPEAFQAFTGFKYFKKDRLRDIKRKMLKYVHRDQVDDFSTDTEDRLIRNEQGNLEWDIHGVVLFVDTQDLPRVPKTLFWKICDELRAPGCPGPLQHSIAEAGKQLAYMLIFLFVVFIIIMSFHDVFDPSSNNQLLLTVASGFLPLIIRQLIPGSPKVDLSEYSLKGKIEEILLHYRESWPAYDLVDESDNEDLEGTDTEHEGSSGGEQSKSAENNKDRYIEDDLQDMGIVGVEDIAALVAGSAVADIIAPEDATLQEATPGDMDIIIPEDVNPLGRAAPGHIEDTSSQLTRQPFVGREVSDTEGSIKIELGPPPVRLPRYIPKERLLTFATVAGPKEDCNDVFEPVVHTSAI